MIPAAEPGDSVDAAPAHTTSTMALTAGGLDMPRKRSTRPSHQSKAPKRRKTAGAETVSADDLPRLPPEECQGYVASLGYMIARDVWELAGRGATDLRAYLRKLGEIDRSGRPEEASSVIRLALDPEGTRDIDPADWLSMRAEDCWLLSDDLLATVYGKPGAGFVAIRDGQTVAALDRLHPNARRIKALDDGGGVPADGPVAPNLLYWQGTKIELPLRQWRILSFMWERDKIEIQELVDDAWGHDSDVAGGTVRMALSRLNSLLLENGVMLGWVLRIRAGHVVKTAD